MLRIVNAFTANNVRVRQDFSAKFSNRPGEQEFAARSGAKWSNSFGARLYDARNKSSESVTKGA